MKYFAIFLLAIVSMLIIIPPLRAAAIKIGYVEKPNPESDRKIHSEPKPYLASVGMFLIFWILYAAFIGDFSHKAMLIFISSSLIFGIGTLDDWYKISNRDLKALPKLIVQLIACLIVYLAGVKLYGFTDPFSGQFIMFPAVVQFILSVLWMFGVITVINFTDGLDGLAGGVVTISACTLFLVALTKGNAEAAVMSIILVGICLGYLHYNKFPSKILMGDSGATFLGFVLALISLDGAFKQATVISIFIPILALGLPIFDNIMVVLRRIHNKKPVYVGDSTQIHYRLIKKGFTQVQAVHLLYACCLMLNVIAVIILLLKL